MDVCATFKDCSKVAQAVADIPGQDAFWVEAWNYFMQPGAGKQQRPGKNPREAVLRKYFHRRFGLDYETPNECWRMAEAELYGPFRAKHGIKWPDKKTFQHAEPNTSDSIQNYDR